VSGGWDWGSCDDTTNSNTIDPCMMNATLTDAPDEFAVKLISAASQLFPKRPGNVTLTMILNPGV